MEEKKRKEPTTLGNKKQKEVRKHHSREEKVVITETEARGILKRNGINPDTAAITAEIRNLPRLPSNAELIDLNAVITSGTPSTLAKAVTNNLAITDWTNFCGKLTNIFKSIRKNVRGGRCADYIPILAEQDPESFGLSVCTVDGQQFSIGDHDTEFSIQSCVKPLLYGIAAEDHGLKRVSGFLNAQLPSPLCTFIPPTPRFIVMLGVSLPVLHSTKYH